MTAARLERIQARAVALAADAEPGEAVYACTNCEDVWAEAERLRTDGPGAGVDLLLTAACEQCGHLGVMLYRG